MEVAAGVVFDVNVNVLLLVTSSPRSISPLTSVGLTFLIPIPSSCLVNRSTLSCGDTGYVLDGLKPITACTLE